MMADAMDALSVWRVLGALWTALYALVMFGREAWYFAPLAQKKAFVGGVADRIQALIDWLTKVQACLREEEIRLDMQIQSQAYAKSSGPSSSSSSSS